MAELLVLLWWAGGRRAARGATRPPGLEVEVLEGMVGMVMGPSRADSVPYDSNITVKAATRSGESPGVYTRDLAIAAPVCFTGEDLRPVY